MDRTSSPEGSAFCTRSSNGTAVSLPSPVPVNREQPGSTADSPALPLGDKHDISRQKFVRALGIDDDAPWQRVQEECCRQIYLNSRMRSESCEAPAAENYILLPIRHDPKDDRSAWLLGKEYE